ncbi:MAG: class I SAM-dependent methyltransferase [Hyphomonadaceae bacterium]|nr:class I SAM-dependent methyltransferase [Hyphomonadaceae bacterium]
MLKALLGKRGKADDRQFLLDMMPVGAVCAEIGVWKGGFSEKILSVTKPALLYLIDPWQFQSEYPDRMYGGKVAGDQAAMDAIHDDVAGRLGALENVRIIRAFSRDAAASLPDEALDWVYIDGNHYYEYVREDLELFARKVKPGGYITGDDYEWEPPLGFPVKQAVQEFVQAGRAKEVLIKNGQFILRKPPF